MATKQRGWESADTKSSVSRVKLIFDDAMKNAAVKTSDDVIDAIIFFEHVGNCSKCYKSLLDFMLI